MAGLGIRLYTDEMIDVRLAQELRRRGYDAESCQEAGRHNQRIPDPDQLVYAASHGRAILSFNIGDYLGLDDQWKAAGEEHGGIIISPRLLDLGELLRRVMWHLDHYAPTDQHDTVLWLGHGAPS
jgi:hypothetical protein